jgi:hypothetical protein
MFTKLPNKFIERMTDLSGTEVKIMLVIYRHTIGYHQREATLSLSVLSKHTGCSIRQISTATARLQSLGFLTQSVKTAIGTVYVIHDVPEGCCNDEPIEEIAIEEIAIAKTSTEVLQKLPTYKENERNTISNDIVHSVPPKPKRQRKPKEPREEVPTALTVFREYHRLSVPIALRESVAREVDDLPRWESVCKEWVGRGYRKGNVAGCLQVYKEGWKDARPRRQAQRGDIQREQREQRMEAYLAEYEREITVGGTRRDNTRDDGQGSVRGQQEVLGGVLREPTKGQPEDDLPF